MGDRRATRSDRAAISGAQTPASVAGKRKAVKHAAPRGPLFRRMPSAPMLMGITALSLAVTGAVTASADSSVEPLAADIRLASAAGALSSGASAAEEAPSSDASPRATAISRDSRRQALEDATAEELVAAAEAQEEERNEELAKLRNSAEKHGKLLALNAWVLPLTSYRITTTFGQAGGYWSSGYHTGLDMAAPSGTLIMSVNNGTVTSVGYEGSYGNQVVVTTEDGDEIWYNHMTAFAVSVGDEVRGGDSIGYVGSTGNSTGPHLHLEVRPGGGDPVDPYAAMVAHGLRP